MKALALFALVGCGRFDFDPRSDARTTDATVVDGAPIDAAPLGPWGTPAAIPLAGLSSTIDDPSMTADGLELYVNVGTAVYVSTRATTTDAWGTPVNLTALGAMYSPHVSSDGLTLWLVDATVKIAVTTRPDRQSAWGTVTIISELASTFMDDGPSVSSDGLTMVFDSDRDGTPAHIYLTTRLTPTSPWSAPVMLSTATAVVRPWLSDDLWSLYVQGAGPDIYLMERASPQDPFGAMVAVAGVNSTGPENDPWLSQDQRTMLISSQRGTDTFQQIYEVTR